MVSSTLQAVLSEQIETNRVLSRSSCSEVFCKKGVLRNFAKFTGKHLCQSLFFNKVAGLRPAILLKERLWHRCFPVNFAKFLRAPFLTERVRWLLLYMYITSNNKLSDNTRQACHYFISNCYQTSEVYLVNV